MNSKRKGSAGEYEFAALLTGRGHEAGRSREPWPVTMRLDDWLEKYARTVCEQCSFTHAGGIHVRMCRTPFNAETVICPYYRYYKPFTIGCMGIVPDSTLELIFRNNRERDLQAEIFCIRRYDYCEVYRAIVRGRRE